MTKRSDADDPRWSQQVVRHLLLEWDAIGVAEDLVDDEYDCMIDPLLGLLAEGSDERDIVRWLGTERRSHFGLDQDLVADGDLAARLVAWRNRRDGEPTAAS